MTAADEKRYGWVLDLGRVEYRRALFWQRGLVKMRQDGLARDTIIFVEHPPVVTVGRNGHRENFSKCRVEPVFVERGGDVTYHGPGQLVVYFIFNLTRRDRDVHRFMADIQRGIIESLMEIGIKSRRGEEHTGVWVGQKKIASIGVAVRQWITFHGAAVNLNTRPGDFEKINPCGLEADVMTSAGEILGRPVDMATFAAGLLEHYSEIFNTGFTPIVMEDIVEELESQAGGYTI